MLKVVEIVFPREEPSNWLFSTKWPALRSYHIYIWIEQVIFRYLRYVTTVKK